MSVLDEGIVAVAEAVRDGADPRAVVEEALTRIDADDTNAFLHVAEDALEQASAVDPSTPLAGVPIAVKDNLCVRGTPTTCGSKLLAGWVAPYDAHAVQALRRAGAVIVGKTNLDEFGMGSSNETSAYGPVRNPWDRTRVPGGSSGGSAAATAAGLVPGALGSDTGGSVRQPAAFCGVMGLKPTYGRVSRHGLVAFASSLDVVGPFARSTRDLARLLSVLAGPDERDATCATVPVADYEAAVGEGGVLRVGVPRALLEGADDGVRGAFDRALAALEAEVVDVELPHALLGVSVYYLVAPAEASSNLARFDGVRYGHRAAARSLEEMYERTRAAFGDEVKRRILLGTYVLSAGYYDAYYLRASKARTLIRRDFEEALVRCDVVATPTAPTTAFSLGAKVDDPLGMYFSDVYTVPASLAGLPALSTPCGLSDGLPVGLQLVGRPFEEATLLRAADMLERAIGPVPWPGSAS